MCIRDRQDALAGADHGQGPGRGDAEGVQRLADDVLAQHRPDHRLAVAAAREAGASRALEVQVDAAAGGIHELAQQQRAAVAELRLVAAELVAGVGLGEGGHLGWDGADEHARIAAQRLGVQAELARQRNVESHQGRCGRGVGAPRHRQRGHRVGVRLLQPSERCDPTAGVGGGEGWLHGRHVTPGRR